MTQDHTEQKKCISHRLKTYEEDALIEFLMDCGFMTTGDMTLHIKEFHDKGNG